MGRYENNSLSPAPKTVGSPGHRREGRLRRKLLPTSRVPRPVHTPLSSSIAPNWQATMESSLVSVQHTFL